MNLLSALKQTTIRRYKAGVQQLTRSLALDGWPWANAVVEANGSTTVYLHDARHNDVGSFGFYFSSPAGGLGHWRLSADKSDRDVRVSLTLIPWTLVVHGSVRVPRCLVDRAVGNERYVWKRELGLAVHGGLVSLTVWVDPDSWKNGDRRWTVDVGDRLLGGLVCDAETEQEGTFVVDMPEATYVASAAVNTNRVYHSRLPWLQHRFRTVDYSFGDTPVPIPGKGENSWDCEEDAVYSGRAAADSFQEAALQITLDVLKTRLHRGGTRWRPETDEEKTERMERRAEAQKAAEPHSEACTPGDGLC